MNKYHITFFLNESDSIVIKLEEPLTVVHCCYQAPLVLCIGKKQYTFPSESIQYMLLNLIDRLEKAVVNQLRVHPSIVNLGYSENEFFQDKPCIIDSNKQWVGDNNRIWSGKGLTAWLYNDLKGNIFLELTPVYTFPINDPDEKSYIPYDTWIKNYKTVETKKIPLDIAKQWIQKAQSILATIEKTTHHENLA